MPPRISPLPSHLGRVFSVAAARSAGVSSGRLQAGDLEAPFHGVRRFTSSPEFDDDLSIDDIAGLCERSKIQAYACTMQPHAFLVGRSAAVHLGLWVGPGAPLEVGVLAPSRAPRGRGIRGVKVAPHLVRVREHAGVRTTDAPSTWAMLGAELGVRQLVALGDQIVRVPRDRSGTLIPGGNMATLEDLARAVLAGRRRGIARLREALPFIRVGSASPLETEFRLDAAAAGLPTPELDVEIRDGGGVLLGITEIVFPEFRTAVEIEGDHHRTDRKQWNRDIEKYAAYVAEGWEVVRLTSAHVLGADRRGVGIVRSVLQRRGWRP
ncbi:hypothetical protein [Microbacterium sp. CPCC 204701]|uniref:hypothetical protein n=1 Tax=Microbacterium sp. CPCC 204701 TaxID=2493084 RepID=UPI000FD880A4|nr:hypothetical protein [Microbacterium sp. CPCC 204701]